MNNRFRQAARYSKVVERCDNCGGTKRHEISSSKPLTIFHTERYNFENPGELCVNTEFNKENFELDRSMEKCSCAKSSGKTLNEQIHEYAKEVLGEKYNNRHARRRFLRHGTV